LRSHPSPVRSTAQRLFFDRSFRIPLSTETFPLSAGIEINSALIMKTIAAAIVSFDRTDAVHAVRTLRSRRYS
jgi:hypothetical protein